MLPRRVRRGLTGQGDKEPHPDARAVNIELAKLEGKEKATAVGIAGGLRSGRRCPARLRRRFCLCGNRRRTQRSRIAVAFVAHRLGNCSCSSRQLQGFCDAPRPQGLALEAVPGARRGGADGRDAAEPCLRSEALRRSAPRSPPSDSASTPTSPCIGEPPLARSARRCRSSRGSARDVSQERKSRPRDDLAAHLARTDRRGGWDVAFSGCHTASPRWRGFVADVRVGPAVVEGRVVVGGLPAEDDCARDSPGGGLSSLSRSGIGEPAQAPPAAGVPPTTPRRQSTPLTRGCFWRRARIGNGVGAGGGAVLGTIGSSRRSGCRPSRVGGLDCVWAALRDR